MGAGWARWWRRLPESDPETGFTFVIDERQWFMVLPSGAYDFHNVVRRVELEREAQDIYLGHEDVLVFPPTNGAIGPVCPFCGQPGPLRLFGIDWGRF